MNVIKQRGETLCLMIVDSLYKLMKNVASDQKCLIFLTVNFSGLSFAALESTRT